MKKLIIPVLLVCIAGHSTRSLFAQSPSATAEREVAKHVDAVVMPSGPYAYETKPDDEAFAAFNPRKAPAPGTLLLVKGDRLAICGDSITEQKMYSRMIETYLTVCVPELEITARQYGWSGEKTDGFLRRMDQDCLTFNPTIATLAYGMNDSRYRPFDVNNGRWYQDHYSAIVQRFKANDVRVVVGSPGSAGKIASWVKSKAGDLEDHNVHLCALRDIALIVAQQNNVRFADIFWPMYQAQVFAPAQHGATQEAPYNVAGNDGIHPGWAGQTIMAYAFLKALGLDGEIGKIHIDLEGGKVTTSAGHQLVSYADGNATLQSKRYPFCATGDPDRDNSIRSGMTLVPFNEDLNRFMLTVHGTTDADYRVTWGGQSQVYSAADLQAGINLANDFDINPFSAAFAKVDEAVAAKQAYETQQVKKIFHGREGKADFAAAVQRTEAERTPLATSIQEAMQAVTHSIQVTAVTQ